MRSEDSGEESIVDNLPEMSNPFFVSSQPYGRELRLVPETEDRWDEKKLTRLPMGVPAKQEEVD